MFRYLFSISLLLVLVLSASAHGGDDDTETGDAPKPNLRSRSLILVKIWCLILIFLGTFIGGVSPYFLKWNDKLLVLGTQFAGGVFLGTAMMHFLSDANETFGDLTSVEYPFAFMLACGGYLLTMAADSVISYVYGKQSNSDVEEDQEPSKSRSSGPNGKGGTIGISSASSLGDSILLIVALCFHSVFEGIAIGIADSKADAWKALWTISLHKIFAAIAMGIALLRMIPDRPLLSCASYAFAFGISSPIGVAIGIVIDATTQGRVADWIFAISMGIACGVFIYVSINHLLRGHPESIISPHHKLLAVTLGLGVIAVVMIWDT
ncbi:hypothetical protein SSX86_024585 [Deinandra increscens subsp. villosa]|uniref:Uncharacterized protein n=1 Tax=Deinandra increscens subsp. villosa TaxID=3103831 RepID=A0AAP0CPU9_9ASTR